jgi:hypothetical protein
MMQVSQPRAARDAISIAMAITNLIPLLCQVFPGRFRFMASASYSTANFKKASRVLADIAVFAMERYSAAFASRSAIVVQGCSIRAIPAHRGVGKIPDTASSQHQRASRSPCQSIERHGARVTALLRYDFRHIHRMPSMAHWSQWPAGRRASGVLFILCPKSPHAGSTREVIGLCYRGELRHVRIGELIRIRFRDIEAFDAWE